jgi:hypothetical protein
MEDKADLFETLIDRATDYGKTSFDLVKLKALDKSTDIVSSIVPASFFILLVSAFFFFLNMGIAFWLGDILGKLFYGFFVVAGFYIFAGLIVHFVLKNWIKRHVGDYFIKRILK